MALIEWNDRLSVGVAQFDGEHRRLIGMMNDLHEAMAAGKGRDVSAGILAGLADYVATHFRAEEAVMLQHGYPGVSAHKIEHEKLTTQVLEYKARLEKGEIALNVGLLMFLRDWLTAHIQKSDKGYSEFLRERGVR